MTYKILNVIGPRPWESQYGTKHEFILTLEGEPKQALLSQNPSTAAPTEGQQIDLELSPHDRFPDKLRAKKPAQQGGGGGKGSPPDPATRRSIEFQHAQKCAVEALKLAAQFGDYTPPSAADVVAQVKVIASALYQQIEAEVAK